MPTCPRCSANLPAGVQFCSNCGNSLSNLPAAPAVPAGSGPAMSYAGPQQTSGKAIGSLICGIVSVILLPFLASIPAVILGHISLSEIKKSAGRLQGKGMAIAGLVMGYVSVALIPFILIIAAIAIPNLLRARMAANEATAVGSLRTYNTAIIAYATQCQNQRFPASVANLGPGPGDCQGANLVDATLAGPDSQKNGYRFFYLPGAADNSGRIVTYTISADPIVENTTGMRHFFTDQSGVIRHSSGAPASVDSPPLR